MPVNSGLGQEIVIYSSVERPMAMKIDKVHVRTTERLAMLRREDPGCSCAATKRGSAALARTWERGTANRVYRREGGTLVRPVENSLEAPPEMTDRTPVRLISPTSGCASDGNKAIISKGCRARRLIAASLTTARVWRPPSARAHGWTGR